MIITCDLCSVKCSSQKRWNLHLTSKHHQQSAPLQISSWTLNAFAKAPLHDSHSGRGEGDVGESSLCDDRESDVCIFYVIRTSCRTDGSGPTELKPKKTVLRLSKHGFVHNFYINPTRKCVLAKLELGNGVTQNAVFDELETFGFLAKEVRQRDIFGELSGFCDIESEHEINSDNVITQEVGLLSTGKLIDAAAEAADSEGGTGCIASEHVHVNQTTDSVIIAEADTVSIEDRSNQDLEISNNAVHVTVISREMIESTVEKSLKEMRRTKKRDREYLEIDEKLTEPLNNLSLAGSEAISTSGFDESLEVFLQSKTLLQSQVDLRQNLIKTLRQDLLASVPNCQVFEFGSFSTLLADCESDLDLTLVKDNDPLPRNFQPGVNFQYPPHIAANAKAGLSVFADRYTNIERSSKKSQVPSIRFTHAPTGVHCNLSFGNYLGVRTSEMIKFLTSIDSRVYKLIQMLRHWGNFYNMTGPVSSRLTNYTLTILSLVFLARKKILPTIYHLQEAAPVEEINGWNAGFCIDTKLVREMIVKRRTPAETNYAEGATVLQLLRDFFAMMANEDLKTRVICALTAESLPKSFFASSAAMLSLPKTFRRLKAIKPAPKFRLNLLNVQDPFNLDSNLGSSVSQTDSFRKIVAMLGKSAKYLTILLETYPEDQLTVEHLFPENDAKAAILLSSGTLSLDLNDKPLDSSRLTENSSAETVKPVSESSNDAKSPVSIDDSKDAVTVLDNNQQSEENETARYSLKAIRDHGAFDKLEAKISTCTSFRRKELKQVTASILKSSHVMEFMLTQDFAETFWKHDVEQLGNSPGEDRERFMFKLWCDFAKRFVSRVWSYSFFLETQNIGTMDEFNLVSEAIHPVFCSLITLLGQTVTSDNRVLRANAGDEEELDTASVNPMEAERERNVTMASLPRKRTQMKKTSLKCLTILELDPELGPNLTLILTDWELIRNPTVEVEDKRKELLYSRIERMFYTYQLFLLKEWIQNGQKLWRV